MTLVKLLQDLDVMGGIFARGTVGFHLAAVYDQKQQDVDRAMATVFKLLLLNRAGNSSADRGTFKRLQIRHLIDTNDPKTIMHQPVAIGITPENLFCALLEQRVHVHRFPVARAVWLQRYVMQDAPDGARADVRHNPIDDRLTSQILATLVSNEQSLSDWLQTRQLHDLRPLQRGKSHPDALTVGLRIRALPVPSARSIDTFAKRSMEHIAFARPLSGHVRRGRWPISPVRAEPATTVRYGCGQSAQGSAHRERPTKDNAVFALA